MHAAFFSASVMQRVLAIPELRDIKGVLERNATLAQNWVLRQSELSQLMEANTMWDRRVREGEELSFEAWCEKCRNLWEAAANAAMIRRLMLVEVFGNNASDLMRFIEAAARETASALKVRLA